MVTLLFRSRWAAAREPNPAEPVAANSRLPADAEDTMDSEFKRDRWWYESSYDLRHGLDVDDTVASTMPGELIDKLFKN